MDSRYAQKYGLNGANISFDIPATKAPTCSDWLLTTLKFDLGTSPSSPLSSELDSESLSALSSCQEQFNSVSPSSHHTVETDISHQPDYVVSSQRMKYALQEIETALMAPDTDEVASGTNPDQTEKKQPQLSRQRSRARSPESCLNPYTVHPRYASSGHLRTSEEGRSRTSEEGRSEKRQREMKEVPRNDVRKLLVECAEALSENRIGDFEMLVQIARGTVSIRGDPIQRLGAYMVEGLVAKQEASGTNIYRALRCREPEGKELLSYMSILYDICPYFKFGYMAANGAIAEALRNEDRVHIIDFQISQGTQWVTLIQALAKRPGGPPHVRITGIDDPVSAYARGDNLRIVGDKLSEMSKKFNIPVEFHSLPVYASQVTKELLDIRPGEALAVNFTLQLHHTPDESVDTNNPRDGLLRMVKGLSPKVTTLVEQESHTNTTPFLKRFMETLDYYSAMFESIDVTLPRDNKERINVEMHCLAKDIVNIVACEGKDRVERHELLGKWRSRLGMAGFKPYPLSSYVNSVIKGLLAAYSDKYSLVEIDGALLLGWKNRNLISASAWH